MLINHQRSRFLSIIWYSFLETTLWAKSASIRSRKNDTIIDNKGQMKIRGEKKILRIIIRIYKNLDINLLYEKKIKNSNIFF